MINDLTPPTIDFVIPQGTDVREFFTLYLDTAKTKPLNLTEITAESMIRTNYDSNRVLIRLSSTDGTILLGVKEVDGEIVADDLANGGICLVYTNASTSNVRFTGDSIDLVRDVEITNSAGIKRRLFQGTLTLTRESTR